MPNEFSESLLSDMSHKSFIKSSLSFLSVLWILKKAHDPEIWPRFIDVCWMVPNQNREHQNFHKLKNYRLKLNADKCTFNIDWYQFLGNQVDGDRICSLLWTIESVLEFPLLTSTKHLQECIKLISFYSNNFILNCSATLWPLMIF